MLLKRKISNLKRRKGSLNFILLKFSTFFFHVFRMKERDEDRMIEKEAKNLGEEKEQKERTEKINNTNMGIKEEGIPPTKNEKIGEF